MANVTQYNNILRDLRNGQFKPVYLFHGEEPFYIDRLTRFIEQHALQEHERDFNQSIFYGRDVDRSTLLDTLSRYPMMAERTLVVVREAQDFDGKWAEFEQYFAQPMPTTILVVAIKYKKAESTTKWVKAIEKNGVVFESKKHYDNELVEVVNGFVRHVKYRIQPAAAHLLAEYLGNDLEKIEMEVNKLTISVPLSREITVDDIHSLIGVSREYNVWEYVNSLAVRDSFKSFKIAKFLGDNDKNNPFVLIVNQCFAHFAKVMMAHLAPAKDPASIGKIPGVRGTYGAGGVIESMKKYDAAKTAQVISILREYDARFKGLDTASGQPSSELLKEMTYRILN